MRYFILDSSRKRDEKLSKFKYPVAISIKIENLLCSGPIEFKSLLKSPTNYTFNM